MSQQADALTVADLRGFLSESLGLPMDSIADSTSLFDEGHLDSIMLLSVFSFLIDHGGVDIEPSDISFDNFDSVHRIMAFVNDRAEHSLCLERRVDLGSDEFIERYLIPARPVIVTGGMQRWNALRTCTAQRLVERFGDRPVPLYDELFGLQGVSTLRRYVQTEFGRQRGIQDNIPYVRWYSRQSNHPNYPWADEVFEQLRADWSVPSFVPTKDMVLPRCAASRSVDPTRHLFPARGLYLSPAGGRTRLHSDPWNTDAVLCQIEGTKRVRMLAPDQAAYVTGPKRAFADLQRPDPANYPLMSSAHVDLDDELTAGEILYIPRQWLHEVITLRDSVSLTWNFSHGSTEREFYRFLTGTPTEQEVRDIEYFWFDSQGSNTGNPA